MGPLPQILRDSFHYLLDAREKYGDIYLLDVGLLRMVMLNHPRHVHHVYAARGAIYQKKGALWDQMRRVTGNGLAVTEGEVWREQRQRVQPLFQHQRLAAACELLNDAVGEEEPAFERVASSGQFCDLGPLLGRMTMKMTVRVVFGAGIPDAGVDRLGQDMVYVMKYMLPAMLMSPLPTWAPRPGETRYQQALHRFETLLMQVIASRRADGGVAGDLVSLLFCAEGGGASTMTDDQIRDETMTLFLAGYETTAIGLTWAVHYLSWNPAVAETMFAELDAVLGGRVPEFRDLDALHFTKAVWKETLRLAPPIWWNPRRASEDDEIDGFSIPAGTTVAPLTYVVQRHPEVWENPNRFDPDRFLGERSVDRPSWAWLPFGHGRRYCIGQDLATLEAQLALARLVQRYRFEPDPDHRVQPVTVGTLRPRKGIRICLKARK